MNYPRKRQSLLPPAVTERLPSFRVIEGEVFRPNIAKSGPPLAIEIRVTFDPLVIIDAEFSVQQPPAELLD